MKITHVEKGIKGGLTFSLEKDLSVVTYLVKEFYDPQTANCSRIAQILDSMYVNLEVVTPACIIHDGAVERNCHDVCIVKDSRLLIDPTGDYFTYTNVARLKHDIVPWVYELSENDEIYLSQGHIPVVLLDDIAEREDIEGAWDILRLTGSPFYKDLRGIIL